MFKKFEIKSDNMTVGGNGGGGGAFNTDVRVPHVFIYKFGTKFKQKSTYCPQPLTFCGFK